MLSCRVNLRVNSMGWYLFDPSNPIEHIMLTTKPKAERAQRAMQIAGLGLYEIANGSEYFRRVRVFAIAPDDINYSQESTERVIRSQFGLEPTGYYIIGSSEKMGFLGPFSLADAQKAARSLNNALVDADEEYVVARGAEVIAKLVMHHDHTESTIVRRARALQSIIEYDPVA